jgi:hypothetical protein
MRNISDDSQINLFDFDELKSKIELGQSSFVETPAIKTGPAERTLEEVYAVVDEKILSLAANGIALNDLRDKVRNTKYLRPYYKSRRQYLLDNGKIREESVKLKIGRPVTYVYAVHPGDPPPKRSLIVPVEVIDAELVEPSPGALAPKTSGLSNPVRESALNRQDRLFLERFKNPDQREFKRNCESLAGKMYCRFEWVDFEDRQWLTVRQVAAFLGMEERNIQKHLQQFPLEQSVLSEKLTGDRLSVYKQCYPPNPPEPPNSEFGGSGGLGGLNEKAAHEFSSHFILLSPAGVIWLARQSQTPEANALNQEDMMSKEATPAAVEHVAEGAARMARDQRFAGLTNSDISFAAYREYVDEKFEELCEMQRENAKKQEEYHNVLLKVVLPSAARTEEGVGEVRETLVTVGHQMNTVFNKLNAEREPFRDSVKREAARIFLKIHPDGRDIFNGVLIVDPRTGHSTKDCEFDHFNLELKDRSDGTIRNCALLSKETHRRKHSKGPDKFAADEMQMFKDFHGAWQHQINMEERSQPYQPGLLLDTQL